MYATDWMAARGHRDPPSGAACGTSGEGDCDLHLHLRRELEREADGLVQEGRIKEAIELLSELFARRIADIGRRRWRCVVCGWQFGA